MIQQQFAIEAIAKRVKEIKREISVLSTEESDLFFTGKSVDWMVAHSNLRNLREELISLESQLSQIKREDELLNVG